MIFLQTYSYFKAKKELVDAEMLFDNTFGLRQKYVVAVCFGEISFYFTFIKESVNSSDTP